MVAIRLAERRLLPDWIIRLGIRQLLRKRLRAQQQGSSPVDGGGIQDLVTRLKQSPITVETAAANDQHYEVPAGFFERVLGRRLKYSCGLWPSPETTLDQSEEAMLRLTCERAGIEDGMEILDLGCGWGSAALWIAEHYPASRVMAVSNSHSQRHFIFSRARNMGLNNLDVVTRDVARFDTERRFDRVVSVEMFEHVRNYQLLMERIAGWLHPGGKLFVHIFCHHSLAYLFETEGAANWMGRHFFTGGIMPSYDLLPRFHDDLTLESRWQVSGLHYAKTCEAWLDRLDGQRDVITELFALAVPRREADQQVQRWRMFFMACAELFRYGGGDEWFVGHYLFRRRRRQSQ